MSVLAELINLVYLAAMVYWAVTAGRSWLESRISGAVDARVGALQLEAAKEA